MWKQVCRQKQEVSLIEGPEIRVTASTRVAPDALSVSDQKRCQCGVPTGQCGISKQPGSECHVG